MMFVILFVNYKFHYDQHFNFITTNTIKTMKWLGFIALVLIESLVIFGLSLEQIGFTVPQAILISVYAALLIITITGFIIAHFVNLQKERENEFRILVEKLRGQEEAIKTIKEQVFRIGQNVLISEEKLEDIKEEFKRLK